MLKLSRAIYLSLAIVLSASVNSSRAVADDQPECALQSDLVSGQCQISIGVQQPKPRPGDGNSVNAAVLQPLPPEKCFRQMAPGHAAAGEIPCRIGNTEWYPEKQCYIQKLDPQPPKTSGMWEGHTDGAVWTCRGGQYAGQYAFWLPEPPVTAVQVDPRVLAQQAFAKMNLRAGEIGIVPKPGGVGIIGMPQWLWINDPGPQTTGPQTMAASAGGVTVTVTAALQSVVWDMGDGGSVTCHGPGTPYTDAAGKQDSPDCGYRYHKQGTWPVTATSYWAVNWTASTGVTGTIPFSVRNQATVTMGELQVVNVAPKPPLPNN